MISGETSEGGIAGFFFARLDSFLWCRLGASGPRIAEVWRKAGPRPQIWNYFGSIGRIMLPWANEATSAPVAL